jgi:predicted ATPase/DNA-binding CsgD family transcriptional regulator
LSSDTRLLTRSQRLPETLTPLVGRDAELNDLLALLRDPNARLLTVVGAGGIGKTRLALQATRALLQPPAGEPLFAHGVFYAPLAGLVAQGPLDETFANTLAASAGLALSGPEPASAQLHGFLRGKSALLVLDNFEHVLEAAPLVASLLGAAPQLKALITSRERLNLSGERVFALGGLRFPIAETEEPSGYDAVRLFLQAARAVSPALAPDRDTLAAAARICRLVDGSPLGIELAAAWTRLLAPAEIAAEIARSLDFLEGGARDAPSRHRSLRAVFDYSWSQLAADEQRMLRRLAVFRGSFTLAAAAAVAGNAPFDGNTPGAAGRAGTLETLRLLAALIDKSLLRRGSGSGEATRYELAEVLRQYAAERLAEAGDAEDAAARHAHYYLSWLAGQRAALRSAGQGVALAEAGAEADQLRAAWQYAVGHGDARLLDAAVGALFHCYDMRCWFREGAEIFGAAARALEQQPAERRTWARLLARQGWFSFYLGRQNEARTMLATALETLRSHGQPSDLVFPLNYLAAVCFYLGDYDQTEALCHESLAMTRQIGDVYGRAVACNILGQMVFERGEYAAAREWCRQSLAIERQIGNNWSMGFSLATLGKVASMLGEHAEARRLLQESLRIREAMGDPRGVALCLLRLGDTAVALKEHGQARADFTRALELFREIGNTWGEAAALVQLGRLASASAPAAATRLLQEALRLALATGSAPQAAEVCGALVPLMRRAGEDAWSDEIESLAAERPPLDELRPHASRLLAWWWPGEPMPSVAEALAALDTPPRPAPPIPPAGRAGHPGGLTAREVEVLRLVAQGLTDAQVADRLVLSPRTVSTHLTSIYGKLQISSRAAATRFALENGLA